MVGSVLDWFAPITEIEEEEWDRVIALNLKTAFLCCKAVAGVMTEKKKGRIISISSGAGISPNPYKVRDAASIERIAMNPMRHLVEPADTAEAVLYPATAEARYVTGVSLNVNAGNLIFQSGKGSG